VGYESCGREHRSYGWFKENSSKDKSGVNFVEEDSVSEDDIEVCIAEWVDAPKDKPLACSFLKLSPGKKYEVKFTFMCPSAASCLMNYYKTRSPV
jgi:hypothetical protein